jgi:CO/xanthine dehydrogenase Mo-binding subunit
VRIQSGIGNLGTESVFDCHRVAAEILGVPWEKCDVTFGNTAKNLPNTCGQGGSQTTHAMTRAAHAAASDAKEEAAGDRGEDARRQPRVVSGRQRAGVRRRPQPDVRAGGAESDRARRQVRRPRAAGRHQQLHEEIGDRARGPGPDGVARDNYGRDGTSKSSVAGFAEVEVDIETGVYKVLDFVAVADVGTVINPRNLGGQILGGIMLGFGHAHAQHWVYDQQYGVPLAKRFYTSKPPTILDAPAQMRAVALDLADPETPVGARGVGEAPVGAGLARSSTRSPRRSETKCSGARRSPPTRS